MKTSYHCDHTHKYTVTGFRPFLAKGRRGSKDVWVDTITLKRAADNPVLSTTDVAGTGYYARADGTPGLTRTASYAGAHIQVGSLPSAVQRELVSEIRKGAH